MPSQAYGVRHAASFRDRSGYVFVKDGTIYREVRGCYADSYDRFLRSGLYESLVRDRLLVPHEDVSDAFELCGETYRVIRPTQLSFVSYPYEWCFSQLKAAALLTLQIQTRALEFGQSLKDASAFNVQFHEGGAIFIDTLSFAPSDETQPWVGYRQFCEHFLLPLALMSYCDPTLNCLLAAFLDGIPLRMGRRLLPWRTRLKPWLALHVHLHGSLQRRAATTGVGRATGRLSRSSMAGLLGSLSDAVEGMRLPAPAAGWSTYSPSTSYSADGIAAKTRAVLRFVDHVAPRRVCDFGAGTGAWSLLCARRGVETIALDSDPYATEKCFHAMQDAGCTSLWPLRCDVTNPTPAVGWMNRERESLTTRFHADAVLVLALLHHLVAAGIPFERLAADFAEVAPWLLVEFVPPQDLQVQQMLATRRDVFLEYGQLRFEAIFGERYRIEWKAEIADSGRTLYAMQRR